MKSVFLLVNKGSTQGHGDSTPNIKLAAYPESWGAKPYPAFTSRESVDAYLQKMPSYLRPEVLELEVFE